MTTPSQPPMSDDPGVPDAASAPPAVHGVSRRAVFGATAVFAALAGAGVAWRLRQVTQPAHDPVLDRLWSAQWVTPDGASLPMQGFKGRPLLLNFWATWCPPCVQELPLLNAFYRQYRDSGWQVLGLAVDRKQSVQEFLQRTPLDFPVALAGMDGTELSRSLGNLNGALPFSVVIGADGRVLVRKMGQIAPEDLASWHGLK